MINTKQDTITENPIKVETTDNNEKNYKINRIRFNKTC
jgi:hypothetical protein